MCLTEAHYELIGILRVTLKCVFFSNLASLYFVCLTHNVYMLCEALVEFKATEPLISPGVGVPTPLEHSSNIKKCQRRGETP
jgi:hypothetical protein